MYLGAESRGRLAAEMRWRVAALIALAGIVAVPASSGAAQVGHAAMLSVSVKPGTGSARTRFVVGFRAALSTGPSLHNVYRVSATGPSHGGCQSSGAVPVPPTKAGSVVRVALAPSRSAGWCAGTYRGEVWDIISEPCPVGRACPVILPRPQVVGKFTFRVARG